MTQFVNNAVIDNYNQIINKLDFASKLLRKRLAYHNVPDLENKSFDELINKIEDIKSVTHINNNNEKPLTRPLLDLSNISKFNESLFKVIRFYMRKIAYYLVLKGVPTSIVKKAKSLRQLIDLILFIKVVNETEIIAEPPTIAYFGESVFLPVNIIDEYNFAVLKGDIVVKDKETGAILSTTTAGQSVYFTPPVVSTKINNTYQPKTFIIEYHGTEKYLPAEPVEVDIVIYPTKINLQVDIKNTSQESRYHNSTTTGYNTDTWHIKVTTLNYDSTPLANIPLNIQVDNQTITGRTNAKGQYECDKVIQQTGRQFINVQTNYTNTNEFTNSEYTHIITIKYNVIQQVQNSYTDYAGKNYTLEATLHNIDSNEVISEYDNNNVVIFIDGVEKETIHAQNGILTLNIDNLDYGLHNIIWTFYGDDYQTSMKTTMNIKSNFIFENDNVYYLNDLPEISYQPLGQVTVNKKVQGVLKRQHNDNTTTTNVTWYTNQNGILHALSTYTDVGIYELTLTTKSDNLTETRIFNYEIKKPFNLLLHSYNRKESVEYDIVTFYMKDGNKNSTSIVAKNSGGVNITPTSQSQLIDNAEMYSKRIKYSANTNTYGTNTLTVTNNGYTESTTFNFIPKVFTLLTNTVTYGFDTIQIQANTEVDSILIESANITDVEIDKNDNIFTITGVFTKTGNVSFDVIDDINSIETFTINVQKADIDAQANLILKKDDSTYHNIYEADSIPYDDKADNVIFFRINEILYSDITVNCLINNTSVEQITNTIYQKKLSDITPSLLPGQYTVKFVFGGNAYYNGFTKNITFTILKKDPNISFNTVANNMAIYRSDIDYQHPIYNTFTINNADNVSFDVYVGNTKKAITYNNNTVAFLLTEIGEQNLKLITKETAIFNSVTITKTIEGYDYPNEVNNIINALINESNYTDKYAITDAINCLITHMSTATDNCDDSIKQRSNNIIDRMKEI